MIDSRTRIRRRPRLGAGLVLLPGIVAAQSGGESPAGGFLARLDQNGDAALTRVEWQGSSAAFLEYDRDLDGYVTLAELEGSAAPESRSFPAEATGPKVALESFGTAVPALVERHCTRCHDLERVLETPVGPPGWRPVVETMRARSKGALGERDASAIAELLERRRQEVASRAGSRRAREAWAVMLAHRELAGFDEDRSGNLSGRELAAMVLETLDFDGDRRLDPAEHALLPGLEDPESAFRREDRDRDGTLSARELGVPDVLLEVLDADRDRVLSQEEWPGARAGPATLVLVQDVARLLEFLDRDRDGALAAGLELPIDERLLRLADADRDGRLDPVELDTAFAVSRERVAEAPDDFLRRHDLDGDGAVEPAEFPASRSVFRRCDRDGDGRLTAADRHEPRR
jgi:Ca2+-binding EF-hand superfamily protein